MAAVALTAAIGFLADVIMRVIFWSDDEDDQKSNFDAFRFIVCHDFTSFGDDSSAFDFS